MLTDNLCRYRRTNKEFWIPLSHPSKSEFDTTFAWTVKFHFWTIDINEFNWLEFKCFYKTYSHLMSSTYMHCRLNLITWWSMKTKRNGMSPWLLCCLFYVARDLQTVHWLYHYMYYLLVGKTFIGKCKCIAFCWIHNSSLIYSRKSKPQKLKLGNDIIYILDNKYNESSNCDFKSWILSSEAMSVQVHNTRLKGASAIMLWTLAIADTRVWSQGCP